MSIEIRPATPTDIDGIQRVAERAWHSAHGPIIGTETVEEFLEEYYDTETFRSLIENDDSVFDVGVDSDSAVVGFVSASPTDSSTTFALGRIYVLPDH